MIKIQDQNYVGDQELKIHKMQNGCEAGGDGKLWVEGKVSHCKHGVLSVSVCVPRNQIF